MIYEADYPCSVTFRSAFSADGEPGKSLGPDYGRSAWWKDFDKRHGTDKLPWEWPQFIAMRERVRTLTFVPQPQMRPRIVKPEAGQMAKEVYEGKEMERKPPELTLPPIRKGQHGPT